MRLVFRESLPIKFYLMALRYIFISMILFNYTNAQDWSPTVILPKFNNGFIRSLDIGYYNDSMLFVAWDQDTNSNYYTDIINVSRCTGGIWSTPLTISSVNALASYPKFFLDHSDTLHIIWGERTTATISRINLIKHSKWNGVNWTIPETLIVNDSIMEDCYYYSLNDENVTQLIYGLAGPPDPSFGLRYKYKKNSIWYGPYSIRGNDDFNALKAQDGRLHVAYIDAEITNHDNDVYYQYLDSCNGSWNGPYVIHYSDLLDTMSFCPYLAVDTFGVKYCFWTEDYHGDCTTDDVLYSRSNDTAWSNPINITAEILPKYTIDCPTVIIDNYNFIHVGIGNYNDDHLDTATVYYKYYNGSNWSASYIISRVLAISTGIRLLADNITKLHIAWIADTLNDRRICYRSRNLLSILEWKTYQRINIKNISIFPNPLKNFGELFFNLNNMNYVCISIYDVQGKLVKNIISSVLNKGDHQVPFNLPNLSSGIYFLCIETKGEPITRKFILLK